MNPTTSPINMYSGLRFDINTLLSISGILSSPIMFVHSSSDATIIALLSLSNLMNRRSPTSNVDMVL